MQKIIAVNFHGADLQCLQHNHIVFVALKPMVRAIGLAWGSQYNRVMRDPTLSKGIFIMKIPSANGGVQEFLCLRLDLVNGWLFKIEAARIKDHTIRERVLLYQRECYATLFKHFFAERDTPDRQSHRYEMRSIHLVNAALRIGGPRAGLQVWRMRGLPDVPAMAQVEAQGDLFNAS